MLGDLSFDAWACVLLATYCVVFAVGRQRNRSLALAWSHRMLETVLAPGFSRVGLPGLRPVRDVAVVVVDVGVDAGSAEPAERSGATASSASATASSPPGTKPRWSVRRECRGDLAREGVVRVDGAANFKLYASGHAHCKGMLIELELIPRQDLLSLVYALLSGWEDTISVDLPVETMDPFVFTVARADDVEGVRRKMEDVHQFTRQVPLELLPTTLTCLTDCNDLVTHFFEEAPHVVAVLDELEAYIMLIHISDCNTWSGFGPNHVHKQALRFRFRMPPDLDQGMRLLQLCVDLADLVATVRLSPLARESAKECRAEHLRQRKRSRNRGREVTRRSSDSSGGHPAKFNARASPDGEGRHYAALKRRHNSTGMKET